MSAVSGSTNMPDTSAPSLSVGDKISAFSLPDTNGSPVSSTVLLEQGPLIVTLYRGLWCPYCRGDLMALVDATAEVQSCGGSLAAVARETATKNNREFERQHAVGFPILNYATGAVARLFGIGWTEAYLQSLYDQFVADRTGDPPEPSWIEPMQARYVIAEDRFPRSPRLAPLRAALAKLDPTLVPRPPPPERPPLPEAPARSRGGRRARR